MNPETDSQPPCDERCFELLEHPERWPEDAALQAELAGLLELHLALCAHGSALDVQLRPRRLMHHSSWLMTAAAAAMALVPAAYALRHVHTLHLQARDRARIEQVAQKRGQDRLWAAFFQQSSELLADFQRNPPRCDPEHEERGAEREMALILLQASHQLASQGAPLPEAEFLRTDLHAWLTEVSLEDACMAPARAQELQQWAQSHNLQDEAARMQRLLAGASS